MGRSFLFSSFPVAGVDHFAEIHHAQILNNLIKTVRAFIFYLFPVAGVALCKAVEVSVDK